MWGRRVVVLLACLLVAAGCGRRGGHRDNESSDSGGGPDIGVEVPIPPFEEDGSGGGGAGAPAPEPEPEPTDPTEEAFLAVTQGSCLPVYRNGDEWNVSVPPAAISCATQQAGVFQVTSTGSDGAACPTGVGRDAWTYYSSITGNTTALCLNRVWVRNYCVLAVQTGNDISSIASTTAVDCAATEVPAPYNQVLIVAAAYQAPAGANASHCRTGPQDYNTYWYLLADNDATLVCFTSRS